MLLSNPISDSCNKSVESRVTKTLTLTNQMCRDNPEIESRARLDCLNSCDLLTSATSALQQVNGTSHMSKCRSNVYMIHSRFRFERVYLFIATIKKFSQDVYI